jgi:hypothetical protein
MRPCQLRAFLLPYLFVASMGTPTSIVMAISRALNLVTTCLRPCPLIPVLKILSTAKFATLGLIRATSSSAPSTLPLAPLHRNSPCPLRRHTPNRLFPLPAKVMALRPLLRSPSLRPLNQRLPRSIGQPLPPGSSPSRPNPSSAPPPPSPRHVNSYHRVQSRGATVARWSTLRAPIISDASSGFRLQLPAELSPAPCSCLAVPAATNRLSLEYPSIASHVVRYLGEQPQQYFHQLPP